MKISNFINLFPVISILKTYNKSEFLKDLIASITTAVLLIPNGMAVAMIAGLPPVMGIYGAIIPTAIYGIMGSSRQLCVNPASVLALLIASVFMELQLTPETYVSYALLLSIMVGIIMIIMGLLKMGFIENLLSHSVISGFIAAAAIIIAASQIKSLTGIHLKDHHIIFGTFYEAISRIKEVNSFSLFIGIICGGIIFTLKKINRMLPGSLLCVVMSSLMVYHLKLSTNHGVEILGHITKGFPAFHIPSFHGTVIHIQRLFILAIAISIIGFVESLSIAKSIAAKTRQKVIPDQELLAIGTANLAGGLFQSFPVAGGFAGTAVNYGAGAKSGMASIFAAIIVALSSLFITPYLYYLPKACLAAIIMISVIGLIDIKGYKHIFKINKTSGLILLMTFLLTLFIGVERGLLIGIIASLGSYILRTATPNILLLGKVIDSKHDIYDHIERENTQTWTHIKILRVEGSLYFVNVKYVQDKILNILYENKEIKHFILDCSSINHIDDSAEETLREILYNLIYIECEFYMVSVKKPVMDFLKKSDFYDFLGEGYFFETISQAVKYIDSLENKEDIDDDEDDDEPKSIVRELVAKEKGKTRKVKLK